MDVLGQVENKQNFRVLSIILRFFWRKKTLGRLAEAANGVVLQKVFLNFRKSQR